MSTFGAEPPVECPCGSARAYAECCGPLHRSERWARSAEELMRSRYTAYVVGDADYLMKTWHPRTRPGSLRMDDTMVWTGLQVIATADGRECDQAGEVEFVASHAAGVQHERSRFVRRGGRWVYVDAVVPG